MQLTYDDDLKQFIFMMDGIEMNAPNVCGLVRVCLELGGGLSDYEHAYSTAKYFHQIADTLTRKANSLLIQADVDYLKRHLRSSVENIRSFRDKAFGNDTTQAPIPLEIIRAMDEATQAQMNTCQHYLAVPKEELLRDLMLFEFQITESQVHAYYTLPMINDYMVQMTFRNTLTRDRDLSSAIARRESTRTLH